MRIKEIRVLRLPSARLVALAALMLLIAVGAWRWTEYRRESAFRGRTYRIGLDHNPPNYEWVDQKGATGFAVDVLNEAARRSGVSLEWIYCPRGSLLALESRVIDLWPVGYYRPGAYPHLHQTRPWSQDQHAFVWTTSRFAIEPANLDGLRVAIVDRPAPMALARRLFPGVKLAPLESREESLRATCAGEADLAFLDTRAIEAALLDRPADCRGSVLRVKPMPELTDPASIFAWKEHAGVAEVLRDRIDDMTADGTMMQFADRWFSFSSSDIRQVLGLQERTRQLRWLTGLCVVMATAIGLLVWLSRKLGTARLSADRARQLQAEFLANVSHEIRTPMNGVLGTADLLLETVDDPEMREQVETIRESAYSQLELLNQILDQSKIDSGLLLLETTPFSPRRLVEQVEKTFQPMARRKGIELKAVIGSNLPALVQGDGLRIRQVLSNLVNNGIKFTREGSVEIRLQSARAMSGLAELEFSVEDSGIGIPQSVQGSIFEKFRQVDASTTRKYGGTGLGLSISRQLVRMMGGELTVESEVGEGSQFRFRLTLPVARTSGPAETPAATGKGPALAGLHVLVAEDNAVNQKVAQSLLQRMGARVDLAADGVAAVALCRERDYDVVLMDCHMPEMDGYAATVAIRKLSAPKCGVPIVALTAGVSGEERRKALKAGMDVFLAKPVNRDELAATLAPYVRRNIPAV